VSKKTKDSAAKKTIAGEHQSRPGTQTAGDPHQPLRKQLVKFLGSSEAHVSFDDAVANLPAGLRGAKPEGMPYSAWQLLEHLRIALWDILEFSRDPKHKSPAWPEAYWPKSAEPPDDAAWDASVSALKRDLKAMQDLVTNAQTDLFEPIPHGDGQTILREALLVADHNAYHVGQLVLLRKRLGSWGES
jgi:hypothetical protein